MKYLDKILNCWKTVFSYDDISILLNISNRNTIKSIITRLLKSWIIKSDYKWIYSLKKYDIYELASKLKKNSYISFETVLKKSWIIFQDYSNTVFLASNNTISKKINETNFKYNKIKDSILYNPLWIINKWNYMIASPERAICDRLYLSSNYYFDNIDNIDKQKIIEISQIYNKRVILEVKNLIEDAK